MRRSLPLLAASIAVVTLLAGCTGASTSAVQSSPGPTGAADTSACTPLASGSVSDAVKLTATKGTDPAATFTHPLTTTASQRTVVTPGTGAVVPAGATAVVEFALYNGTSGKELTSTGFDGSNPQSIPLDTKTYLPGLVKTIQCSTIGSRIVGVLTPADLWGSAGNESLGVAATDSVVFVVDVDGVAKAAGEPYSSMTGMPGVTFDASGKPTITIPKSDPPTTTRVGIITEGTGAVVPTGATVTVNYTGVLWRTGKVFDSSWERGTPAQFTTTGVVKGFELALDQQKVGSTLISVVTPKDGYGTAGQGDIKGTDTMVFVVKIISIDG